VPVPPTEPTQSRRAQPQYDQLLKWLLSRSHDEFLELIAPGLTWLGEHSPEVPAVARYADLVWEVERADGRRGLLHIELQLKVEDDIGERLAEYAIRLWRRDHLPVRSLVIYLRHASAVPTSPFVIPWEEQDASLRYSYGVVRLWELPPDRVLASSTYALWPLSSLMAGATVETTLAVAERLAATEAPRQEKGDLIGLLAGLAGIAMAREQLMAALRSNPMIDELLRESSLAELFIEEGIEEGERRMARRMAQAALEGRFGKLSAELVAAIAAADEATLLDIVAHAATETLEQVRARLGLQ
jgi:hypothetical protein